MIYKEKKHAQRALFSSAARIFYLILIIFLTKAAR